MKNFDLNNYEEVKDRIPKFYKKHEDGRIITKALSLNSEEASFVAMLYKNAEEQEKKIPLSTGYAYEQKGEGGFANDASWVENCETSAIGRALANMGLHGDKRSSREEMSKVNRMSSSNHTSYKKKEIKENVGKCSTCSKSVNSAVKGYSLKKYKKVLCRDCQAKEDK